MSTLGEQSVLRLLDGSTALPGYEGELARPDLWNSSSGNYGPTAELTLDLELDAAGNLSELAASALRWERHLEPGVPGVAMRIEPNSSTYVPWIVCPVDGMTHVMRRYAFGQPAVERAHWWLRAWLTVAALAMGTRPGKLIDDETDPPGDARPGPVFGRSDVDRQPWTHATWHRTNPGILPSVLVGERAWQRSYPPNDPDADWRLCRGYLDQSQHSQIAMLALDLPWRADTSDTGDWSARFLVGLRRRFGAVRLLSLLTDEERANIRWAWELKRRAAVERVLPYLDGWLYQTPFVLAANDNGSLWMLSREGGTTSTAPTYAATWDAETGESAWLACDSGIRKSSGALDAVVSGRGWEDGDLLRCERSDHRYGVRTIAKPSGRELWRLELGPDGNRLAGAVSRPPVVAVPNPQPEPPAPAEPPPADGPEVIPHENGWLVLWPGRAEVLGWPADDGRTMVLLKGQIQ